MRSMLTSLVAASLLAGPLLSPAFAAECTRPVDHAALDVTALKTQLMVMALTCQADDRYNQFIVKYRPDLNQADKSLASYFARSAGRNAAKQRDDYVTQLANSQSQTGLKQGSRYCDRNLAVFDEVMALRNNAELNEFAAGKASAEQPISVRDCTGSASVERVTHTTTRSSSRHR